MNTVYHKFWRR